MKTSYDPECEKLARYFLQSEPGIHEGDITALAGTIQRAVEDWWATSEPHQRALQGVPRITD